MTRPPSPGRTGRRAVAGLVLSAGVAFAAVGGASWVVAHRIARADALDEALRTARGVGTAIVAPVLPAVLRGDRPAAVALADAVASRRRDGTLIGVTVWTADGTVAWSDDPALMNRRLPLDSRLAAVFDAGRESAGLSGPDGPERADQLLPYGQVVETDTAVRLDDGRTVAVEMYFPDTRVRRAEDELGDRLVPFSLLSLLVLAVAQLPVSIGLIRRVIRSQQDRDRMLEEVLVSTERERRQLARNLHDGVVQDLAGATYVLQAGQDAAGVPDRTRQAMLVVSGTLQQSVVDLREMLVELHPLDLTGDNLGELIGSAAVRICPDQRVTVTTAIDRPMAAEVAAFLYRCARECALNVAKHADADEVTIRVASNAEGVTLVVDDDGTGPPPGGVFARADGHLGLVMLRQAAADLGGSLAVGPGPDGRGTRVRIALPA